MLIPYNTDAPLYHFPLVTIGLIVVNTVVFGLSLQADPVDIEPWILQFGDGLHPLQWVTCNFFHADIIHLLGNMFFLWGFGLVVEGKLGCWRFLLLYLAIGAIFCAILQIIMLRSEGSALGASGVIFGLMAISLIWAPKNEMNCFLLFGFRPITVDVSISAFAGTYIIWQIIAAWLTNFNMPSEIGHLAGAGVGAVFGVALLKLGLVDCEGWDFFAVWGGREGQAKKLKAEPELVSMQPPIFDSELASALTTALKGRIAAGDATGAARFYQKQRAAHPEWNLDEPHLMSLVKALHQQKLYSESMGPMIDYLRLYPDHAIRMRLKLAEILTSHECRPAKALQVLSKIEPAAMTTELQPIYSKLKSRAEKLQEEADLEPIDDDEW